MRYVQERDPGCHGVRQHCEDSKRYVKSEHPQYVEATNSRIVKDGWGDRHTFQESHRLSMSPQGIEEGKYLE